jgi:hypothetical protein
MSAAGSLQSGPNVIAFEGPQLGLPRPSSSEPRRSERNSPLRREGNIQFCKNSHGGCMRCRPFGRRAHLQRRLWGFGSAVSTNLHPRRRGEYRRDNDKKRRQPSQSCDMQRTASWPHAAVLASSKGRLTSATRASNEKPRRRWERRPGQVFAERVVTGGRCSAERNITAGAVRAVLLCRL